MMQDKPNDEFSIDNIFNLLKHDVQLIKQAYLVI